MHLLTALLTLLLATPFGNSARQVNATQRIENISDSTARIVFNLTISDGWHVYSTALPQGGPTSAVIHFDTIAGVSPQGPLLFQGKEIDQMDDVFGMRVRYFKDKVTFYQNIRILENDWIAQGALTYGACNDVSCLPPQKVEFSHHGIVINRAQDNSPEDTGYSMIEGFDATTWAPAAIQSRQGAQSRRSLWGLFLTSFIGGLIALLTPCV